VLGKPVGSDLREGKVTLAVIHALERCSKGERAMIETVLRERAFRSVTLDQVLDILARYGSVDYASARASEFAQAARDNLAEFPDSEIKRALLWVPEFVVEREK
jgi:octaprenyl-diphosphate synthase